MICLSISENSYEKCIKAIADCKMAEIRIDLCQLQEIELERLFSLPIETIATCREGFYNENDRIKLLKLAIESGASHVDIEIEASTEYKKTIIEFAKKHNCKIIISYHNFNETPNETELQNIIDDCFEKGADIAKIACKSNSKIDNTKLLNLYKYKKPIVVIGMGEIGKETRIKALSLGAPFTFASPLSGKQTAEGQIDIKTIKELISQL